VLAALIRRDRTDEGATVDVSLFDATAEWLGHPMYIAMYAGRQVPRMGLSHASIAPYDSYPTKDGEILIGIQNDRGWRALTSEVFDSPGLAHHPHFATNLQRVDHRAECDAVVAEQTLLWTTEDLDRRLAEVGIPAAQVNDVAGLVAHPQLSGRDRWRDVRTANGVIQALLPPMTFRDVELPMGDIPALGEHTDMVLAELGFTPEDIVRLRTYGAIQ